MTWGGLLIVAALGTALVALGAALGIYLGLTLAKAFEHALDDHSDGFGLDDFIPGAASLRAGHCRSGQSSIAAPAFVDPSFHDAGDTDV